MRWLEKINAELISTFENPSWIDVLVESSEGDLDKFSQIVADKEQKLLSEYFLYLCYSILEGEYAQNNDIFNELISEIHTKIGTVQYQQISEDETLEFSDAFQGEKFLFTLKKGIELYSSFSEKFHRYIVLPRKNIVFSIDTTLSEKETKNYFNAEKQKTLEINLLKLTIATISCSLRCFNLKNSDYQLQQLIEQNNQIKDLKNNFQLDGFTKKYHTIIDLQEEINIFLIRKLIIRKIQNGDSLESKYLINRNEYDFSLDQHQLKFDFLQEWDKYSSNHFLSEKNDERLRFLIQNFKEINNKINAPTTFFEAHCIIKNFKDISKNIPGLINLKSYFALAQPKSNFNKYAYNVSKNYLTNNILSIELEEKVIHEISNDWIIYYENEITQLQKSSAINNFFPYYKICNLLKNIISEKISTENSLENGFIQNLSEANDYLKSLNDFIKKYKNNLNWSKENLFNAFQLPFEECKTKYSTDKLELNIFIPNTFSLPIDFDKYESNLNDLEIYISNTQNEIKMLRNLANVSQSINQKDKSVQNLIDKNLVRNVELLGIFSAIIALLFQGAFTAQSAIDFEARLFTFALIFVSLFSFMMLLRFFVQKEEKIQGRAMTMIIIFLCSIILLLTIINLFLYLK